jgi:hypothetical protein
MEMTKKKKDFDCVAMKNDIQAKIYAETKGMNVEELLAYFNISSERDPFRKHVSNNMVLLQ